MIVEVTLESDFMVPRDLVEESVATASSNPMSEPWEAFLRNDNMFGSSAAPSDLFEQMQLPQQSTRDNLIPLYDYDDMQETRTKLSEDTVESILASNESLKNTMYGISEPMIDLTPTTSVSDMSLFGLSALPLAPTTDSISQDFLVSSPSSSSGTYPYELFNIPSPLPGTVYPRSPTINHAMSDEDSPRNTFGIMNSAPFDLHSLISDTVPITQMELGLSKADVHSDTQHLSSLPCLLPFSTSSQTGASSSGQPDCQEIKPLYVAADSNFAAPQCMNNIGAVVSPVVSKQTAAETSLGTVSRALASVPKNSSTSMSVTAFPDLGLLKLPKAQKLYECPTCCKVFVRAYNRKKHMETHEALENRLRPFICSYAGCGKSFSRKHDMNRHYMGVHFGIRKTPTDSAQNKRSNNTILDVKPTIAS